MKQSLTVSVMLFLSILGIAQLQPTDAKAVFKAKCAVCHGNDGLARSVIAQKLAVKSYAAPEVQKQSDDELKQVISEGKGKMPPFRQKLSPEQIASLTAYVRTLEKK